MAPPHSMAASNLFKHPASASEANATITTTRSSSRGPGPFGVTSSVNSSSVSSSSVSDVLGAAASDELTQGLQNVKENVCQKEFVMKCMKATDLKNIDSSSDSSTDGLISSAMDETSKTSPEMWKVTYNLFSFADLSKPVETANKSRLPILGAAETTSKCGGVCVYVDGPKSGNVYDLPGYPIIYAAKTEGKPAPASPFLSSSSERVKNDSTLVFVENPVLTTCKKTCSKNNSTVHGALLEDLSKTCAVLNGTCYAFAPCICMNGVEMPLSLPRASSLNFTAELATNAGPEQEASSSAIGYSPNFLLTLFLVISLLF